MMVGSLLSFWGGLFSRAMLKFQGVDITENVGDSYEGHALSQSKIFLE